MYKKLVLMSFLCGLCASVVKTFILTSNDEPTHV